MLHGSYAVHLRYDAQFMMQTRRSQIRTKRLSDVVTTFEGLSTNQNESPVNRNGVRGNSQECFESLGHANRKLHHVIVVDDDTSMQHVLANYLEQHNMRVFSAAQRHEAIRQFAAAELDLVILDLRLGEENGLDLLREIRSERGPRCRRLSLRPITMTKSTAWSDWSLAPMIMSPNRSAFANCSLGYGPCCAGRRLVASPPNGRPSKVAAGSAAGSSIVARAA
jgi:CheY-like chemotaxis protein